MSSTILVLDTNAICRTPRLKSPAWLSLISNLEQWQLEIVIPDVVLMETVNVVRRTWQVQLDAIRKLKVHEFGLAETVAAMVSSITTAMESYETDLRGLLEDAGARIAVTPDVDLLGVARRASEGAAPYTTSDKDGFRDTLIWLTLLDVGSHNPASDVWFVSDNIKDFGDKGSADTDDDCPYPFHCELTAELNARNSSSNIFYVRSLSRLEQHLVAQFSSLPTAEREALVGRLDIADLHRYFDLNVCTSPVQPQVAALPLSTAFASIIALVHSDDALVITDAARRAADTWTAQFVMEFEATIELIDGEGAITEIDKPLRATGRVSVAPDGAIDDLIVTSIEALPKDPMRRAWKRRQHRQTLTDTTGPAWAMSTFGEFINPLSESTALMDAINNGHLAINPLGATDTGVGALAKFSEFINPPTHSTALMDAINNAHFANLKAPDLMTATAKDEPPIVDQPDSEEDLDDRPDQDDGSVPDEDTNEYG